MGASAKITSGAEAHEEKLMSAMWAVTAFVFLVTGLLVVSPHLEHFKYVNESSAAVLVGFCAGATLLMFFPTGSTIPLQFDETVYFVAFLPPVIFAAGFNAPTRNFFNNILPICLFGILGTLVSTFVIALGIHIIFPQLGLSRLRVSDCLLMGCIFSATDSVATLSILDRQRQPRLYSLVFGEGVLNDATSIVLVRSLLLLRKSIDSNQESQSSLSINVLAYSDYVVLIRDFLWLFVTSLATGIVFGLFSAIMLRRRNQARLELQRQASSRSRAVVMLQDASELPTTAPHVEVALIPLLGYLSYLLSETIQLSGILTVFASGLVMSTYTSLHLSPEALSASRIVFSAISTVAEHAVLVYVGIDSLDMQKWAKLSLVEGTMLYCTLLVLICVGRAAFVFPFTALSNMFHQNKIPWREALAVWWSGLIRGAVSIALSYHVFSNNLGKSFSKRNASIIAVTLAVVLSTTVVLGCITKSVFEYWFNGVADSNARGKYSRMMHTSSDPPLPSIPIGAEKLYHAKQQRATRRTVSTKTMGEPVGLPAFVEQDGDESDVSDHSDTEHNMSQVEAVWKKVEDRYITPYVGQIKSPTRSTAYDPSSLRWD